jgi:hypothetical protein
VHDGIDRKQLLKRPQPLRERPVGRSQIHIGCASRSEEKVPGTHLAAKWSPFSRGQQALEHRMEVGFGAYPTF